MPRCRRFLTPKNRARVNVAFFHAADTPSLFARRDRPAELRRALPGLPPPLSRATPRVLLLMIDDFADARRSLRLPMLDEEKMSAAADCRRLI